MARTKPSKGPRRPPVLAGPKRLLAVTLEQSDYAALQQLASNLGMATSTYVRMLIKQQINQLRPQETPSTASSSGAVNPSPHA